jgi:hypothetical protein
MKVVSNLIFWISILLIFVFVALPIIIDFTSLQFTNDHYKSEYEEIRFYWLPIIILLTLFGTIKKRYSRDRIIATVGFTVLVSVVCFLVLFFSVFAGMCTWTDNKTLLIKADDPTIKIILRDYGCGATDSGSPIYKVFKVKRLTSYLVSVTDIDTTKLDKTHWICINRKE